MPLSAFPKCFLDALCVTREMTVDEWIDLARQFDVDGLEFYSGFIQADAPEEWARLRAKVDHYKDSFWEYPEFAQRTADFLELVNSIPDSPWFGVNYDPSNAIIAGEDPIQLLEAVKHRVKTMHASDRYFEGGTLEDLRRIEAQPQTGYANILKHGVIGRGLNNYDAIFSILAGAGFHGWISIEDGPDPLTGVQDIAESARFLRTKMKQHGLP